MNPQITYTSVVLSSIGFSVEEAAAYFEINIEELFQSMIGSMMLPQKHRVTLTEFLSKLETFAIQMADEYHREFLSQDVILIAVPTEFQCMRYNIPVSDSFFTTLIGKIVAHLGTRVPVNVIDLRGKELNDDELLSKSLTWVRNFLIV